MERLVLMGQIIERGRNSRIARAYGIHKVRLERGCVEAARGLNKNNTFIFKRDQHRPHPKVVHEQSRLMDDKLVIPWPIREKIGGGPSVPLATSPRRRQLLGAAPPAIYSPQRTEGPTGTPQNTRTGNAKQLPP